MAKHYTFTDDDMAVLREMAAERRARNASRPKGAERPVEDDWLAPEVYVAVAPGGGVPALVGTVPGEAECEIYRIERDDDGEKRLERIGEFQQVYNIFATTIPARHAFVVAREKFGTWLTLSGDFSEDVPDIGTGTGTGTSHESCPFTIVSNVCPTKDGGGKVTSLSVEFSTYDMKFCPPLLVARWCVTDPSDCCSPPGTGTGPSCCPTAPLTTPLTLRNVGHYTLGGGPVTTTVSLVRFSESIYGYEFDVSHNGERLYGAIVCAGGTWVATVHAQNLVSPVNIEVVSAPVYITSESCVPFCLDGCFEVSGSGSPTRAVTFTLGACSLAACCDPSGEYTFPLAGAASPDTNGLFDLNYDATPLINTPQNLNNGCTFGGTNDGVFPPNQHAYLLTDIDRLVLWGASSAVYRPDAGTIDCNCVTGPMTFSLDIDPSGGSAGLPATLTVTCVTGSGTGSGTGTGGGGIVVTELGTVSSAGTPLTLAGVSVLSGELLVVSLAGLWGTSSDFPSGVTFNGTPMINRSSIDLPWSPTTQGGNLSTWYLSVPIGTTGSIVATFSVGPVASYLTAVAVSGLTNNNADALAQAQASTSSPDTGPTGSIIQPVEYIHAAFCAFHSTAASFSFGTYGNGFIHGQEIATTPSTWRAGLTNGHQISSAIGTFDAILSGAVLSGWGGVVATFR